MLRAKKKKKKEYNYLLAKKKEYIISFGANPGNQQQIKSNKKSSK